MEVCCVRGNRVLLQNGEVSPATITIANGIISAITRGNHDDVGSGVQVIDAGDLLVMPGIVDSHVHVNEPGRTDWEGYETATRAAAAGGITTIVDMPLNSIPSTVTMDAFSTKLQHAKGQCHVDVAFWGGVIPGNQFELKPMIKAGISGFKCFLIFSGVDEFPHVSEDDLHDAMTQLQGMTVFYWCSLFEGVIIWFHAEVAGTEPDVSNMDATQYKTFLESRPCSMENSAIELVAKVCLQYRVPCHIVHLSSAEALPIIRDARAKGAPLSVETCHHYLTLAAETIPSGATQYKCCPPIREQANQDKLWDALKSGDINMIVSDHSPCTANLKVLEKGDFMEAWGGISSLQFGLSLFWTNAQRHDLTIQDLHRLMCVQTAKLCGLSDRKGEIKVGMDADFVIWDPDGYLKVEKSMIEHKNKVTPYEGKTFNGRVHKTIVRGQVVYDTGVFSPQPLGKFIFRNQDDKISTGARL
uniref:allantoinase n=1 Tax=Saccoglossus kowalevskii TaxID=10224 RepID=A0ABM0MPA1_SACKO|nr:PREDICTED: allantoinase, mitochondrial-like [Saccoglossus kowalevskii]